MTSEVDFAGFDSDFDESTYSILGVPYDRTSSFRLGSGKAPDKIRKASYCFEPYLLEYESSLSEIPMHDQGNIGETEDYSKLKKELKKEVKNICDNEKFPIVLGGEHSLSPIVVSALKKEHDDLDVLILDAHLDFRDEYEGLKHSHATVSKRISETVGLERTFVYGVRSTAKDYPDENRPVYFTSKRIREYRRSDQNEDMPLLKEVFQKISRPTYLSIDMDVIDPAYAPGVGNPEPFGLEPRVVKDLISKIAPRIVGLDIVEVCPKYDDSDLTSNLAARFVYEILGARENY
ncbi:MAG: agmatinase [Candidatus Thermoplasmatota archaeon]